VWSCLGRLEKVSLILGNILPPSSLLLPPSIGRRSVHTKLLRQGILPPPSCMWAKESWKHRRAGSTEPGGFGRATCSTDLAIERSKLLPEVDKTLS
jgi:hypothetical protein